MSRQPRPLHRNNRIRSMYRLLAIQLRLRATALRDQRDRALAHSVDHVHLVDQPVDHGRAVQLVLAQWRLGCRHATRAGGLDAAQRRRPLSFVCVLQRPGEQPDRKLAWPHCSARQRRQEHRAHDGLRRLRDERGERGASCSRLRLGRCGRLRCGRARLVARGVRVVVRRCVRRAVAAIERDCIHRHPRKRFWAARLRGVELAGPRSRTRVQRTAIRVVPRQWQTGHLHTGFGHTDNDDDCDAAAWRRRHPMVLRLSKCDAPVGCGLDGARDRALLPVHAVRRHVGEGHRRALRNRLEPVLLHHRPL